MTIDDGREVWRVIYVKTLESATPLYYRIINLHTLETRCVPAYRIFDEIINDKLEIENIRCNHNKIFIVNNSGYLGNEDIITTDEFENKCQSILDWSLRDSNGFTVINSFDSSKNKKTPSKLGIDSEEKIYWHCSNNSSHNFYCDFATYKSMEFKCPICQAKEIGKVLSFRYWCRWTNNDDIEKAYDDSYRNKESAKKIQYLSKAKRWFRQGDCEVQMSLHDITVKKSKPHFVEE